MSGNLMEKITDRSASLAIIGLGYVGLPLALEFCRARFSVTGIDVDATKVGKLNDGISYVEDIPNETLQEAIDNGFRATTDVSVLSGIDCISICVPSPRGRVGGWPRPAQPRVPSSWMGDIAIAASLRVPFSWDWGRTPGGDCYNDQKWA